MVFISPLSLNYDVSLHLSFLAVLGILYTQKFFGKIFYFLPDFLAIKEAFILTLSAMSFALPIILFNFGQLSIMSPFANIAVTWTIPLAML
jgi:predicted membrane metal-binding protein